MKALFSKFTKTVIAINIFFIIILAFLYFSDSEKFKEVSFSVSFILFTGVWFSLDIIYVCHRSVFESLMEKYCGSQAKNELKISELKNSDTERLEQEWKNSNLVQEKPCKIKNLPDDNIKFVEDFLKVLTDGEYKKLLQDIPSLLKTEKDSKKNTLYRIFLEFAFSQALHNEYSLQERIYNLQAILSGKIKNPTLNIEFYLSYIGCNLFTNNYEEAENASFKAILLAKKEKVGSSFLTKLYKIQIPIFMCQRKISEALAAGKEGIRYGDKKTKSEIYYDLANIYFYYLHNTHLAARYASLSWCDIYKEAKYVSSLVTLYYVSHFFDDQIIAACDFLKNYIERENNQKPIDNLSYLLYRRGSKDEALKYAQLCVTLLPKDKISASQNTLARLAQDKGNYREAVNLFSEILPSFSEAKNDYFFSYFWLEILYNRSICYLKLGNFEAAQKDMDIVLKSNFDEVDSDILEEFYENGITFFCK